MHDIAEIQWPGIEYHNVKISAVPVVTRGMMRGGGMLKDPSAKHAPSTFDSNSMAQEKHQHRPRALLHAFERLSAVGAQPTASLLLGVIY